MEPKITGLWITRPILDLTISRTMKFLLNEIASFHANSFLDPTKRYKGHLGCFAGNKYLAEFLGIKIETVSKYIKNLKELGFIEEIYFDGRIRVLQANPEFVRAALVKNPRQTSTNSQSSPGKESKTVSEKNTDSHVRTKIDTNKVPSSVRESKKDPMEDFKNQGIRNNFCEYFSKYRSPSNPGLPPSTIERFKAEHDWSKLNQAYQSLFKGWYYSTYLRTSEPKKNQTKAA